MPFNGSGVFTRLYNWTQDAANSINIRADRMDNELNGFAAGLSNCMTRDGEAPPTANIPMGAYKFTGLGLGGNPGESLAYEQLFTNSVIAAGNWSIGGTLSVTGAVTTTAGLTIGGALAVTGTTALTGTATAPTPAAGDSSTKIATTAFVASTAFNAALPSQTGNAGSTITTDGTTATWDGGRIARRARMAAALI